jgi:MraZ protein
MITGEFRNALDEKGRLLLPARIRAEIPGNMLMLTRGIDNCLWLFPLEDWTKLSQSVMENTSPFDPKARLIQRRIIAPAQEVEVDKSGRINIPPTLREVAGLKKETIILGIKRYIEIWDETEYRSYWEDKEQEFQEAAAELGNSISF